MKINYDRLFSVKVHNPDQATLLHDTCKLILVRLLKRKHKNTLIYTEYNPENPNSSYPDIWMKIGERRYVFEIQKQITTKWLKQIIKRYDLPNYELIVIPIDKMPKDIYELRNKLKEFII